MEKILVRKPRLSFNSGRGFPPPPGIYLRSQSRFRSDRARLATELQSAHPLFEAAPAIFPERMSKS